MKSWKNVHLTCMYCITSASHWSNICVICVDFYIHFTSIAIFSLQCCFWCRHTYYIHCDIMLNAMCTRYTYISMKLDALLWQDSLPMYDTITTFVSSLIFLSPRPVFPTKCVIHYECNSVWWQSKTTQTFFKPVLHMLVVWSRYSNRWYDKLHTNVL